MNFVFFFLKFPPSKIQCGCCDCVLFKNLIGCDLLAEEVGTQHRFPLYPNMRDGPQKQTQNRIKRIKEGFELCREKKKKGLDFFCLHRNYKKI